MTSKFKIFVRKGIYPHVAVARSWEDLVRLWNTRYNKTNSGATMVELQEKFTEVDLWDSGTLVDLL